MEHTRWLYCTIVLSIVFVLLFFIVLYLEFCCPGQGEYVCVTENNTRTLDQKMDRLYEMACFPVKVVRWHIMFLGGFVGSLISVALLRYTGTKDPFYQYLILFFPTFLTSHALVNYQSRHAPWQQHLDWSKRLRIEIADML